MDFGHDLFVLDGLVYIYFIYITIKLIFAAFVLFFFLGFIPFSVFNLSHFHLIVRMKQFFLVNITACRQFDTPALFDFF